MTWRRSPRSSSGEACRDRLPPIRLHDLRHGAATIALASGAEMREVQALLRHASIVITMDTYTSVLHTQGPGEGL